MLAVLAVGRVSNAVLTALLLNAVVVVLGGGYTLPSLAVPGPSLTVSVAAVLGWVGFRSGWARRDRLTGPGAVGWMREHAPELVVGGLVAVGLALRLWGIGFGAPLVVHPDEHQIAGAAITMLKRGWFEPNHVYPTAFIYLLLPLFALTYARGVGDGRWAGLGDLTNQTFEFYYVGRAFSAVLGALTILLVYRLAAQLWPGRQGRWTGVLAAVFLTFSVTHARGSHYAVADAAVTVVMVAAVMTVVAACRRRGAREYALAGFVCGLACAIKYSALPVVVAFGVAHLMSTRPSAWLGRPVLVGAAALPVGFLVGYPYALLQWEPFLDKLGWYMISRPFDPGARLDLVVFYSMESGLGPLYTVVFGGAAFYALHRRGLENVLLLTVLVATVALLTHSGMPFYARYLMPVVPFAALVVGRFLVDGSMMAIERFSARRATVWAPAVCGVLAVAMLWPQAAETVLFNRLMSLDDTRAQAYRFILDRFDTGTTVASDLQALRYLPSGYRLERWAPGETRTLEQLEGANVDIVLLSSWNRPTDTGARGRLIADLVELRRFTQADGVTFGPTVTLLGRAETVSRRVRPQPDAGQ